MLLTNNDGFIFQIFHAFSFAKDLCLKMNPLLTFLLLKFLKISAQSNNNRLQKINQQPGFYKNPIKL